MFRETERLSVMNQTEKNRDLVRRYLAAMNAHDLDALGACVADGMVNHTALPEAQGRAGLIRIGEKLHKAFPDAKFTLEDLVAENDRVVCRFVFTGTNTGDLEFTRWPLKATGRRVEVGHVHIFRIEGEKIVEGWAYRDDLAMMRQLGSTPVAS